MERWSSKAREEDLLEAEMTDDWKRGEEPMCELMRHVANPVGWGLGDVVEWDTSV